MATDKRKVQLEVGVDPTQAKAGLGEIKKAGKEAAQDVAGSAKQASDAIDAIGTSGKKAAKEVKSVGAAGKDMSEAIASPAKQTAAAVDGIGAAASANTRKVEAAERNFVNSIQRRIAALQAEGKSQAEYVAVLGRQRGVTDEFMRPYLQQLAQAERLHQQATGSVDRMGMSAKQTNAALRQLPAQFTDIVTSLASGQAPLTVFLQQGGQIKDVFGGAGAALRAMGGYVLGLINPLTLLAGVGGAVALAYYQGASEAEEFQKQIILTGGAAGVTSGQLQAMAASIGAVVGTQGQAAEVLAALVATGRVSQGNLQGAATAIIAMSQATGASVQTMTKDFADLGKAPAETIRTLNERMHFLSASVYEQIRALEQQGRADEAAALAQKTYAEAVQQRGQQVRDSLGLLERGWLNVKEAASGAWNAMMDVGRPETVDDKIRAVEERLAGMRALRSFNERIFGSSTKSREESRDEERLALLREEKLRAAAGAVTFANRQKAEDAGIAAKDAVAKQYEALLTGAARIEKELKSFRDRIAQIRLVDPSSPLLDPKLIAATEAEIRKRGADKDAQAAYEAGQAMQMAVIKAASSSRLQLIEDEQQKLALLRAQGILSEEEELRALADIQGRRLLEKENALRRELALENQYKPKDEADRLKQRTKVIGLQSQIDDVSAERNRVPLELQGKIEAKALAESRERAKLWADTWMQANDLATQFADQAAAGMAALITNPVDRANAEADIAVAALKRRTDQLARDMRNQIDILKGSGAPADAAAAAQLQQQLDAVQSGFDRAAQGLREKARGDIVRDYLKNDDMTDFAAGFDKASQSMGVFAETLGKLTKAQEQYTDAKRAAGTDAAALARIEQKHARDQLGDMANLTGAARGMFRERTGAYKALTIAEQVLRATEIASSTARIATKLAEGNVLAAVGVANQAAGDPYTAIPRMAAMAAAMAALGFAVSSVGGGGTFAPTNTGTGTVLGDPSAQSASVQRSIEALKEVDTMTMRYSAAMLASLQGIESSIGGLASLLVRSGGLSASAAGIQTGFERDFIGNALGSRLGAAQLSSMIGGAFFGPLGAVAGFALDSLLGGAIGNLVGNLFGTKTTIKAQGVAAGPQTIDAILSNGFDASYFNDIEKKKKFLGVTTSTKRSTVYSEADPLLEQQFGTIVRGFADAIYASAGPLGKSLSEVEKTVHDFVLDIGRVDLKDLSGSALQERLTAVFSAAGDRLASAALTGFESFQKVGEGYLETVVRVASGVEQGRSALSRLGIAASDLTAIVNRQGDVGAELVRQSLLTAEGLTGIADILRALNGSATEIAQTYRSLTDVRLSLKLLGLDASAVGADLINGAGGLQDLVDAVGAFETGFLSQGDQATNKARRVAEDFKALGLSLPSSGDQFVALVRGIDTSTEAGKQLLGSVLGLSGGFSDLLKALQDMGGGIEAEINRIKGLEAAGAGSNLAQLQATFALKTAQARAGDQAAISILPQISQTLLKAAEAQAVSSLDVAAIQARTLASLQATLATITDPTKRLSGVPGFASGGMHAGGGRIVGETGAEFEVTGRSLIVNAQQTVDMFTGMGGVAGLAGQLQTLCAAVATLQEVVQDGDAAVARPLGRLVRILEGVTQDGVTVSVSTPDDVALRTMSAT